MLTMLEKIADSTTLMGTNFIKASLYEKFAYVIYNFSTDKRFYKTVTFKIYEIPNTGYVHSYLLIKAIGFNTTTHVFDLSSLVDRCPYRGYNNIYSYFRNFYRKEIINTLS